MRVIAGTHRGRRLAAPDTPATRPVTDRVKEALFSSLGDAVVGAHVLDLFAGAGSFGIEAMSRGAAAATFVESGRKALGALRGNLSSLGLSATVVAGTVERFLDEPRGDFDIVFCDPPWPMSSDDLTSILDRTASVLADEGLVVVSRRASDAVPVPESLRIDDERTYGDTRMIRYRPLEDG